MAIYYCTQADRHEDKQRKCRCEKNVHVCCCVRTRWCKLHNKKVIMQSDGGSFALLKCKSA